jgi:hypothetical protein
MPSRRPPPACAESGDVGLDSLNELPSVDDLRATGPLDRAVPTGGEQASEEGGSI